MALMNVLPNESRLGLPMDPSTTAYLGGSPTFNENSAALLPGASIPIGQSPVAGGAPQGINWGADPQTLTQQLTAYFASKGVPPTEVPYWVSKAPELVQRGQELGNPGYADQRLGAADILGGGGGSSAPTGTNAGLWGGAIAAGGQIAGGLAGGGATMGALGGDPASIMAMDPGYQFRLGQGLQGIERSAAAKGTLLTGGTGKALERYGQDYASGEFGNIFNRNLSLAQLGENAAAGVGNFGSQYAANAGNLLTGAGNAGAAGTVGAANAWSGTLGNISNDAMLTYLMGRNVGGATA